MRLSSGTPSVCPSARQSFLPIRLSVVCQPVLGRSFCRSVSSLSTFARLSSLSLFSPPPKLLSLFPDFFVSLFLLPACPFLCQPVFLSTCLSAFLPTCLSSCLSARLSFSLLVCFCANLLGFFISFSANLSFCLHACLLFCPLLRIPAHLLVSFSGYLFVLLRARVGQCVSWQTYPYPRCLSISRSVNTG